MSPRDLVSAALRHEETPTVPYSFMFSPPAEARLREHYNTDDLQAALDIHLHLFAPVGKPLYASPDDFGPTITDEFGVVWATSHVDRGYPVEHPLKTPSLAGYEFPDPLAAGRWGGVAEAAAKYPTQFHVAVIGDLWERAHFLRGLDALLCDLVESPGFVHSLLESICAYNLATLERMAMHSPDAVFISDDYGFQDRMMMSPAMWRRFVKPHLSPLLAEAQARGLATMLHTCGHVTEIIPDLIEIGLDILHPIQPEAMDIPALKREFGRDLTFCGGISTQRLLPFASPAEVRAEVLATIAEMSHGGGYITEPGITLQADIPTDNLVALIETARDFRR